MNYDLMMLETCKSLTNRKKLLLHVCCGPCCSNVVQELNEYFDIDIYYSNSNIYPSEEYYRRLNELKELIEKLNQENNMHIKIYEDNYTPKEYTTLLATYGPVKEGGERCFFCYKQRMDRAHEFALANSYDYFTTVLSVSPHKNSQKINEIGMSYQDEHLTYLFSDFKKRNGYKKSVDMTKKYNLYRQNYCGCVYSYNDMLIREKNKAESL